MTSFNISCLALQMISRNTSRNTSHNASHDALLVCNHCDKICKSKSGLINHTRSCINKIKNNKHSELKICYCCNTIYLYNRPNYCNICKEILDLFELNTKNLK